MPFTSASANVHTFQLQCANNGGRCVTFKLRNSRIGVCHAVNDIGYGKCFDWVIHRPLRGHDVQLPIQAHLDSFNARLASVPDVGQGGRIAEPAKADPCCPCIFPATGQLERIVDFVTENVGLESGGVSFKSNNLNPKTGASSSPVIDAGAVFTPGQVARCLKAARLLD